MVKSKLNNKNLIVLKNLCNNSRISTKDLATKAHISKQAMHKKLKKIESDYISKYVTLIDHCILGYSTVHIYFKIQGISRKGYNTKIKKLQNFKKIIWVSNFVGDYDLGISIMFKTIEELNEVISNVYVLFKGHIKNKELHLINTQYVSPMLYDEKKPVICFEHKKKIKISDIERKIIKYIEYNPRFEWTDISSKVGINYKTLQKNIIKLEKNGIIKGYGVILNYKALDYDWSICILSMVPGAVFNGVIDLLKREDNVPFISTTLENDIIFDYVSKSFNELKEFLDKLQIGFSKVIDTYKILNVLNLEKLEDSYP